MDDQLGFCICHGGESKQAEKELNGACICGYVVTAVNKCFAIVWIFVRYPSALFLSRDVDGVKRRVCVCNFWREGERWRLLESGLVTVPLIRTDSGAVDSIFEARMAASV